MLKNHSYRGEITLSRKALITGASGGIGRAIAKKLAQERYSLILHYHQNREKAEELAQELTLAYGNPITLIQADLSQPEGIQQVLQNCPYFPDVLIHNAGRTQYGLFTDISEEEYNEMIHMNLTAPFQLTQRLLPSMLHRKWGRVIFITSIWGETGASCESLYSMVKGGLISLTKSLAKELAPSNICVNAVSPGVIDTPMMKQFEVEDLERLYDEIPMGRMGSLKRWLMLFIF